MGQTRLIATTTLGLALALGRPEASPAAQSRFVAYDSEGQCAADRVLPAPACANAFARARAEFEAKTPSFPTAAACGARFRDCMAWPPGATHPAGFRPRWGGVEIVDTPGEKTVTPMLASAGPRVTFAPQALFEPPPVVVHRSSPATPSPTHPLVGQVSPAGPPEREPPPSAPPPPGSGFKLENGVLTYPAPARFQPKNLPESK